MNRMLVGVCGLLAAMTAGAAVETETDIAYGRLTVSSLKKSKTNSLRLTRCISQTVITEQQVQSESASKKESR